MSPKSPAKPSPPASAVSIDWTFAFDAALGAGRGLSAAALFFGMRAGIIGTRPVDTGGLRSQPLTANPPARPILDSAISPDGKYLAYVDSSGFYLEVIGAGEIHRLEMPPGLRGHSVSWFPDGARPSRG